MSTAPTTTTPDRRSLAALRDRHMLTVGLIDAMLVTHRGDQVVTDVLLDLRLALTGR